MLIDEQMLLSINQEAQMAKLVDALVSGTSGRKAVQVRFLFWAPIKKHPYNDCKGVFFV